MASKALQGKFKVDIKNTKQHQTQPRPFVPRKPHRKSRDGCYSCKEKRIKCDEKRPICSKCTKSPSKCVYSDTILPAPDAALNSMALDLVATDLSSLLGQEQVNIGDVRLLHHFQSAVSPTLGCSKVRSVMQSYVGSQAWSAPFLMEIVLAISCAHHRRMSQMSQSGHYQAIAEATHWGRGLQLYRQHLSDLQNGVISVNVDAVIATTFLSIMYTFTIEDPQASAVNDFSHTLQPLAATGGFRSLYYLYESIVPSSKWAPVLFSADDQSGTFTDSRPGIDGMPRLLVHLCELSASSTSENNPYHRVLRAMTPLLHLWPSAENFPILFAFLGRTWPDFKPLVLRKDPRGLLLLSYWFGLLRQVDQWWLTARAKTECATLVAYLSSVGDLSINDLLPFPAAFYTSDASYMWQLLRLVIEDSV